MNKATAKDHLNSVLAALPEELRRVIRFRSYAVKGDGLDGKHITVKYNRGWNQNTIRVSFTDSVYDDAGVSPRSWKERARDGLFGYKSIADYIVRAIAAAEALTARRTVVYDKSQIQQGQLDRAFESDPVLSTLNLDVSTYVRPAQDHARVDINVSSKGDFGKNRSRVAASLKHDGQRIEGTITVDSISMEQLVALLTVLRFDQRGPLDLITLADDSILGPAIRAMIECQEKEVEKVE